MGRTINYTISKETDFTYEEFSIMKELTIKYNSEPYRQLWTCESFELDRYKYYPNLHNPKVLKFIETENIKLDKYVNQEIEKYMKSGKTHLESLYELKKRGFIFFMNDIQNEAPDRIVHGFTKVLGDESCSLLLYMILLELSQRIPSATVEISDQGKFLLSMVYLKNGKAIPVIDEQIESIKGFCGKIFDEDSDNYKKCLQKLDNYNLYESNRFKENFGLDKEPYSSKIEVSYIEDHLTDFVALRERLINWGLSKEEMYANSIKERELKDWFSPELCTRQVDEELFKDYKKGTDKILDGYKGEGFGLCPDSYDSEKEGYLIIDKVKKMFEQTSGGEIKIEILKNLNEDSEENED